MTALNLVSLVLLVVAVVASTSATISNPFAEQGRHLESPLPLLEVSEDYNGEHSSRIVGGAVADRSSRPYQAALLIDERYFCGGSVISDEYLVTAGHCAHGAKEMVVALGAFNLTSEDEQGREIFKTTTFMVHENFTIDNVHNDIALVKFPEKIAFSQVIKAIALPPSDKDVGVGTSLTASGWGKITDQATSITPVLREVTVPSISNDDCAKAYGNVLIWEHMLCTAGTGGKGTCNGDSGGPLTEGSGDSEVLQGVVSFGHVGGCSQGDPDGFTRVTHYVDWIKSKTGIN